MISFAFLLMSLFPFFRCPLVFFDFLQTHFIAEIGLNHKVTDNIDFRGYMDVVIHNKTTGRVKIIDIKTSTMGWNKYMKADKNKTNQLLLYKYFFLKQSFFCGARAPGANNIVFT